MTACPLHPEQERPCGTCGVARVRAALAAAPRPPIARESTTPTRDLAIARKRADQENQHG